MTSVVHTSLVKKSYPHVKQAAKESIEVAELVRSLLEASANNRCPIILIADADRNDPETAVDNGRFAIVHPGAFEPLLIHNLAFVALYTDGFLDSEYASSDPEEMDSTAG